MKFTNSYIASLNLLVIKIEMNIFYKLGYVSILKQERKLIYLNWVLQDKKKLLKEKILFKNNYKTSVIISIDLPSL